MTGQLDTAAQINALVAALEQAVGYAQAIQNEYSENGNDSLANIDYGALLNTQLTTASEIFGNLDCAGLFTMGLDSNWQPAD